MDEGKQPRNCYCNLWITSPALLQEQGVQPGFCGTCETCASPGHLRHYPGPVPATGAWCDVCYRIQAHKGPNRTIGIWCYNSNQAEERSIEQIEELSLQTALELLRTLTEPRSALILLLPSKISVDYYIQPDRTILMEYGDWHREVFVAGAVERHLAEAALSVAFAGIDIRAEPKLQAVELEWYEENPG
jgi:hypothetical protein